MGTAAPGDVVSVVDDVVMFLCPACPAEPGSQAVHAIEASASAWTWNGSTTAPTFTPSVLVNPGQGNPTQPVCHSFVTEGQIRFLDDCTHPLAGQTVDLPLWSSRYG